MKTIFTMVLLISNLTLFSQVAKASGDYVLSVKTKEGDLNEWKLNLNENGTFLFHYYSNVKFEIPSEKNIYGKGKWTIENNLISFISDNQKDIDQLYTLNFTNTKARFITKSPRDKSDKIIKTQLRFLESEISWMRRIDIDKI